MRTRWIVCPLLFLLAAAAATDDWAHIQRPAFVTLAAIAPVNISAGKAGRVEIRFRVGKGYHINSSKPTSELLIPTELKLQPLPQLKIGKIAYPAGHNYTLKVAPDENLNVYTGEVTLTALVSATRPVRPGSYVIKGELRFQACNDNSCFPPKSMPVEFTVNVTK